jgi:hypothetical protein
MIPPFCGDNGGKAAVASLGAVCAKVEGENKEAMREKRGNIALVKHCGGWNGSQSVPGCSN